jgi:hypothetical protein
MPPLALVVEPSGQFGSRLEAILSRAGWHAVARATLEDARRDIAASVPALLVASLKLGSFNGTHLVYLVKLANPKAMCVIYGEPGRGQEAQGAGAVYVERRCIQQALPDLLRNHARTASPGQWRPAASTRNSRLVEFRSERKS